MYPMDAGFFANTSLTHLSSVKTVQLIWQHLKVGEDLKTLFPNSPRHVSCCKLSKQLEDRKLQWIRKTDNYLDQLSVPKVMKDDLSFFVWEMYQNGFDWLIDNLKHMHRDPNIIEKMRHFIDNMSWNSVGFIDGSRMMDSYVRDRVTIDFHTFEQLCYHCSEKNIQKFAKIVEWKEKSLDRRQLLVIIWYYKVFGSFPCEAMYTSAYEYLSFRKQQKMEIYSKHQIDYSFFKWSLKYASASGVEYFWRQLPDSQKAKMFLSAGLLVPAQWNVFAVYFLSEVNFNEYKTMRGYMSHKLWGNLVNWPWALFVGCWIKEENKPLFTTLFRNLIAEMMMDGKLTGPDEYTRRLNRGHLHAKYYIPGEKLWTLCVKKFGAESEIISDIAGIIFGSQDIILCKMIMKETESYWRQIYWHGIRKYSNNFTFRYSVRPDDEFCDNFMNDILINERERAIFRKIIQKPESSHSLYIGTGVTYQYRYHL